MAGGADPVLAHQAVESVRSMAGENLLRGLESRIERLQGALEAQGETLAAKLETHAKAFTAALEAQAKSQSAALGSLEVKQEAQIKAPENSVQSLLVAYTHGFKMFQWVLGGIVAVGIAITGFVLQGARSGPSPADPPTPPISSPSESPSPTATEDPPVPTVLDDVGNTSVANP